MIGRIALALLVTAAPAAASPVDQAVTRWLNRVEAAKAGRMPAIASPLERELYRRTRIDQAGRVALDEVVQPLAGAARDAARQLIRQRLAAIDLDNLAYVKSVLPADGWFRHSRDGEQVAGHAWLIVHHAEDWAFRRQVLAAMAPLAAASEVRPSHYALLYDRVALHDRRAQRYGSQVVCRNGRTVLQPPIEAPDGLDARRRGMELEPIADYLKRFPESC
jgi:hypothetical protein